MRNEAMLTAVVEEIAEFLRGELDPIKAELRDLSVKMARAKSGPVVATLDGLDAIGDCAEAVASLAPSPLLLAGDPEGAGLVARAATRAEKLFPDAIAKARA